MGKRRNRKKKANKDKDPQRSIDFPNDDRTPIVGEKPPQKTSRKNNEKTSRSTSEGEASSIEGPVRYGTLYSIESSNGSKDPTKSCSRSGGFKSENGFPRKSFADCFKEEPKCVGIYENKLKNRSDRPSVPAELGRKISHDDLINCISPDVRSPARNLKKRFEEVTSQSLRNGEEKSATMATETRDEKTNRCTSESKGDSNAGPVRCESLRTESANGSEDPGIYEHQIKYSNDKSSVSPECTTLQLSREAQLQPACSKKISHKHLSSCTSANVRDPARNPKKHFVEITSLSLRDERKKSVTIATETCDEKISRNTSENEEASKVVPVRYETLCRTESANGNKDKTKRFISSGGIASENGLPRKSFPDCAIGVPKCVGINEHKFKNNFDKRSVAPEWGRKISHDHLGNYTSAGLRRNPKKRFEEVLKQWLPVRNISIGKLRQLLEKISIAEAEYNTLQLNIKYGSRYCKMGKISPAPPSLTWEFLYSLGSFACDVASGLTSVSHMLNTDTIQYTFQEIMIEDTDATKKMYEARSKYIKEYQYTEEIIRKFSGTTLGETLGKISEAVGITEFFQKMQKAKNNNEDIVMAAMRALDSVMTRNCNREVGREVVDAVQELVDTNPACMGAAVGVGKSLYGAADLSMKSGPTGRISGALVRTGTQAVDLALMTQEQFDIRELERKIEDGSETTIGKHIQEALDMFETEKKEMLELLRKLQLSISITEE